MEILEKLLNSWKKNNDNHFQIIAFGSSNSELHWHSLGYFNWFSWLSSAIREWVGRHITTINQGICGDTVKDLCKRIDRDIIYYKPDITIITIGGNDANIGMDLHIYRNQLEVIINKLLKIESIPVLQTYYCPIYEEMPKMFQKFPEYMEVNRTLASKSNLPLIDQYKYFYPLYKSEPKIYSKIMLDGLHVNEIGNAIMGIIACRTFNLPDPIIIDRSFYKKLQFYLERINHHQALPKAVIDKQYEQVRDDWIQHFQT